MLCKHCKNALFNELWGNHKCKIDRVTQRKIIVACPNFAEGTPEISKEDRYPEED